MLSTCLLSLALVLPTRAPQDAVPPAVDAAREAAEVDGRLVVLAIHVAGDSVARERLEAALEDPFVVPFIERHVLVVPLSHDEAAALLPSWARPVTGIAVLEGLGSSTREVRDEHHLLEQLRRLRSLARIDRGTKPDEPEREQQLQRRMGEANVAKARRHYDDASRLLLWAWDEATELDLTPVRSSFIRNALRDLAVRHEPTRRALEERLAAAEALVLSNAADAVDYDLWIDLLRALAMDDELVDWFERVRGEPDAEWHVDQLRHEMRTIFITRGRYEDMLALYDDPAAEIRRDIEFHREFGLEQHVFRFRESRSIYRALLRTGQVDLAQVLAAELVAADASAANVMPLVEAALAEGHPHPRSVEWLEACVAGATPMVSKRIAGLLEQLAVPAPAPSPEDR